MNGPYTPLSSKNTYTKLGDTVSSTTWQPSYNAVKSGQARKVSATLATFQTALSVCGTACSAFSFLTCCTQDWLQSTYRAGGCLGHLCWLKVCAPSVSVMVRLPLFSLLQLHVFSSKFEKSFQVLSWKRIFYPLFSRTLKSQSYFGVHVSGSFCCSSDCDIQLKRSNFEIQFFSTCGSIIISICIFRMYFLFHQNWGFALCII